MNIISYVFCAFLSIHASHQLYGTHEQRTTSVSIDSGDHVFEYIPKKSIAAKQTSYQDKIDNDEDFRTACQYHKVDSKTSHINISDNALHRAIILHNHKEIRRIVEATDPEKKYDINKSRVGDFGATALHTAVQYAAQYRNNKEEQQRYFQTIKLLLEHDADPYEKNFHGQDLHDYAKRKNIDTQLRIFFK